jgi:hypothetical protein
VIKKKKIGRKCSKYRGEKRYPGLWWRNMRKGDHLEDLHLDRRIILK